MHKNVTCILEGAFADSRNLQKLVFGKKMNKIEDGAFTGSRLPRLAAAVTAS